MPPDLIQNCSNLYRSCEHAGNLVAKMNPDIVLLITPHGLALSSGSYAVYLANGARGNALWNDCFQDIELSIRLDAQVSSQLLEFVQKRGFKADGIFTFSRMESPLRWGEVVPLWFVDKNVDSEKVKYVIVSFARNGDGFHAMGKALYDFVTTLEQRLAVVVSGDLAHTHATTCDIPLYLPDRRWDLKPTDIAEQFDWTCEMWARGVPCSGETIMGSGGFKETNPWIASDCFLWLQRAAQGDPVARSCGQKGFQILHGVLEKEIETGGDVTSHFLARCAPTYYGMMTVVFDVHRSL